MTTDAKIAETLLAAACRGAGCGLREALDKGFRRVQVIPRFAAATAAVRVLGWSHARAGRVLRVSLALLFSPSRIHQFDPRAIAAAATAGEAAAKIRDAQTAALPVEAVKRRRLILSILAEHASCLTVSVSDAIGRNTPLAVTARRRAIRDMLGRGLRRGEVAQIFGITRFTVSRVASGAWPADRPHRDGRSRNGRRDDRAA